MASGLAVEGSGILDLNTGEQEGASCGVEAEPSSAPDVDRVAETGVISSGSRSSGQQVDVDVASNMDAIDVHEETQAADEAVERSGVTSTAKEGAIGEVDDEHVAVESASAGPERASVPEFKFVSLDLAQQELAASSCEAHNLEVGVSKGSSEGLDDKGHLKVPQEMDQDDFEEVKPESDETQTVSVSGGDETGNLNDGLCKHDSAHQDVGDTPCDVLEIKAGVEVAQDSKVQGIDDRLDGNDQKVAVDEAPEVSDTLMIHNQQDMAVSNKTRLTEKPCSCLDDTSAMGYAGVGRNEDECLADAVAGMESTATVESGETVIKDHKTYVSQVKIHPNSSMEIQGSHMENAECQTGHDSFEGNATVVDVEAKMAVENASYTEENTCMDNRLMGHTLPGSDLDLTAQPHGSNLMGTGCHVMTIGNEASVNVVGVKTERLVKVCDVVKTHAEVGEISNGTELTMDSQLITENCSSVNEDMNHDAIERIQAGTHQNDLEVDNAIHGIDISAQKYPVGNGPNLLKLGSSEERYVSKNLDLHEKNIGDNAGDSLECPNALSDAQVVILESRNPVLADEHSIEKRDVTVSPAWSNIELKSSDICSTDCNLTEKGYFLMEGLNLSVEISPVTASELSEIQAVISQDIESADKINEVEVKLVNPGDIDMDDDHEPYEGSEKQIIKQGPTYMENDKHACYYTLPDEHTSFSISDLVWGKVKSHPWWPGQIFDPSEASELALKHQKRDSFLVAYFGDKTFAWCDESQLKPFEAYFSQMEKQSSSDAFVNSIDGALEEVSRQTELGMTCFCCSTEATSRLACQKVENAGIREGSKSCVVDRSRIVSCFHPNRLIHYAKALAQMPCGGAHRLELAIAKAHLKAFYKYKGYLELPFLQNHSSHKNSGKGSTECLISTPADSKFENHKSRGGGNHSHKQTVDSQMEKTPLELTDVEVACELANGGQPETGAGTDDQPAAVYSGKMRKAPDSDSSDSDGRKKKKLDSVSDMELKLPSPSFSSSFKVGECIRRVASQLTGSPAILRSHVDASHKNTSKDNSVFDVFVSDASYGSSMHSPKTKLANPEDYSQDDLLSQLSAAAVDPIMGYSFVAKLLPFFTDFRNFCVVTSTEQSLPEKSRRGRKRKVETQSIASILITDHMQDSYWSDLTSSCSPSNGLRCKEATIVRNQRRKRKAPAQTSSSSPSVPVFQNAQCQQAGLEKPSLIAEQSIIRVEEKKIDECSPTALFLNFNGLKPLPSGTDLTRMFSPYGPLKEVATEVKRKNNCVKVVFKRRADAEIAFSNTGKYSIFGPSLVSYRLRYLPLDPDPSSVTESQESNLISFEDVNFEISDNCQLVYMSPDNKFEDKNNEMPTEGANLEIQNNCSIAYASLGGKSEDKSNIAPLEDQKFEIADSHLAANVSTNSKSQDKIDIVPTELGNVAIPDNVHTTCVFPDTSSQDKADVVPMEDSSIEASDICQDNAFTDTMLEDSNLDSEIPDSRQSASISQATKSEDKDNTVPVKDSNLEDSDIFGCNASLDTTLQPKDDAVLMEDNILEILDGRQIAYVSPDTLLQDKNDDTVPLEDNILEIPDSHQIAYASPGTLLQDKNDDTVPMEDNILEIPDGHQIAYASPETKLQDENDDTVPMEDNILEILDGRQVAYASPDTKFQGKNDAVAMDDSNLEIPDVFQDSTFLDMKSQDNNDTIPNEDNHKSLNSRQIAYVSLDTKLQDKDDVCPMKHSNLDAPEICQHAYVSPDNKSEDKDDAAPVVDSHLSIPGSCGTAFVYPYTMSQDINDSVPMKDGNVKTPDISQGSEDKDAVSFEDSNCEAPDQTVLASSDIKSGTFKDSTLRISNDCQTSCTSDTKAQDKNDAILTEDGNMEPRYNSEIACTSPDTKSRDESDVIPVAEDCQVACSYSDTKAQDKNDAILTEDGNMEPRYNSEIACTSPDTKSRDESDVIHVAEDCQVACSYSDAKSQENANSLSFVNSNLNVPVQVEKGGMLHPMQVEVASQESMETLPQLDQQTG